MVKCSQWTTKAFGDACGGGTEGGGSRNPFGVAVPGAYYPLVCWSMCDSYLPPGIYTRRRDSRKRKTPESERKTRVLRLFTR